MTHDTISRLITALRKLANQLENLQRTDPQTAILLADQLKTIANEQQPKQ